MHECLADNVSVFWLLRGSLFAKLSHSIWLVQRTECTVLPKYLFNPYFALYDMDIVEDINIGIASASSKLNNAQIDGAGLTIYSSGGDKTLTWDN